MAVRIKLGDYQSVTGDPLGRDYIGCFPRMTEAEAWQAGRGVWKMNRSRAAAERFALITGMGKVLAVAEIEGVTGHGDRVALEGHPLPAGTRSMTPASAGPTRWPTSRRTRSPTATCPKRPRSASARAPAAAAR